MMVPEGARSQVQIPLATKGALVTEKEILGVAIARSSVLLFVMWAGGERHWAGDLFFSSVGVRNYRK